MMRRTDAQEAAPGRCVVWGNGAMARVVAAYAGRALGIAGFTVDDAFCGGGAFCGLPLVPFSRVADAFPPDGSAMIMGIGFTDMNRLRLARAAEVASRGYRFARFVHPSVTLHADVAVAAGAVVLDHAAIHPGCALGAHVFLSSNVNLGHDCRLGAGCWLNAGVSLAGGCTVGARCVFGVNASVAEGVVIGEGAFIGANTLAARDVPPGAALISGGGALFPFGSDGLLRFAARGRGGAAAAEFTGK